MKYIILILLLTTTNIVAQQTCNLESEVPSTTPNSRFTDNGNGTISDEGTGLMWQKCQLGLSGSNCTTGSDTTHTWQQALNEADSSSIAEYNDWRLPNHKELLSIVEQRCRNPTINTSYFPNSTSSSFMSSTPRTDTLTDVWTVNFYYGKSVGGASRSSLKSVRLVRFE